ncbi:hypothetical protein OGAPHI_000612 [Ogataea philodendri]|uniref:Pre-mRNA-splicing factor PRP46 n=1 Tax=Ogataea philodendri TaxID=1378263 RepID=A0A9P8PFD8_9ASCO|nr:uncharacterized protein OGAPHI_000612 [Ogataea philodendri]KAH3670901.1 hypothetical protein OGAPHI_000612 [Ogataea philodendri]
MMEPSSEMVTSFSSSRLSQFTNRPFVISSTSSKVPYNDQTWNFLDALCTSTLPVMSPETRYDPSLVKPAATTDSVRLYSDSLDLSIDDEYSKTIRATELSAFPLPRHIESKLGKRSILDKLRAQPLVSSSDSALVLSNSTLSKDELTNSALVPLLGNTPKHGHNHKKWKLNKVLLGHTGQVTSVAFDPFNKYFATGSADSTIKIWNLAASRLDLTLTGHIMAVRGIVVSDRHPYMFTCSEDKTVKCWDLEKNAIIRDYHGHLSSVYSIDVHPTLDLIVTGGRDSSVRVWDIRTKTAVYTFPGHKSSVNQVRARATNPQVISSSMDSTVKTWDLIAGKCDKTLTYHSKSVRSFALGAENEQLITASSDGIKKFQLPDCSYLQNVEFFETNKIEHGNTIINTLATNADGVMFGGCDNGKFAFWDWQSGEIFQQGTNIAVPGSLEGEKGILCSQFDHSGLRLITGNVDKSIKIWGQMEIA